MSKILAVIPARAGSKGIPNKNIRLLNDKPLISYTIENAKKSKYITNIIVSTDSVEVEIISKQLGVPCKKRKSELCKDDITLDSVIYDAVGSEEYDYVITMQPTSPTLNYETLDKAIEYCMEEKLDSLISVVNHPHLSWKEENGRKIPNYENRINRQFLPPHYEETGAFLISKYNCVTNKSRIGKKLDVFEVSEEEAIDIDTFKDLQLAENIMCKKQVGIYVNGNNKRGVGHIYRVLELADEFYCKPDIYFDINQTDKRIFGDTTHNLIPIDGINQLFDKLKSIRYDIFINDILTTSIDYMIGLRNLLKDTKIINFEDDGEGINEADLVINALYEKAETHNMLAGEKYYIASKTFMYYEPIDIKEEVKKVFISFGGADPQNYSDRLLRIISKEDYRKIEFVVVLGRAKNNVKELLKYNCYTNIKVLYDISNMPDIMSNCDIGITSRGRTGYELALLGIPSIAMAQNYREEKHGFVNNENGFLYLGCNPDDNVIEDTLIDYMKKTREERLYIQEKLLSHDLRNGRKRVMKNIEGL